MQSFEVWQICILNPGCHWYHWIKPNGVKDTAESNSTLSLSLMKILKMCKKKKHKIQNALKPPTGLKVYYSLIKYDNSAGQLEHNVHSYTLGIHGEHFILAEIICANQSEACCCLCHWNPVKVSQRNQSIHFNKGK